MASFARQECEAPEFTSASSRCCLNLVTADASPIPRKTVLFRTGLEGQTCRASVAELVRGVPGRVRGASVSSQQVRYWVSTHNVPSAPPTAGASMVTDLVSAWPESRSRLRLKPPTLSGMVSNGTAEDDSPRTPKSQMIPERMYTQCPGAPRVAARAPADAYRQEGWPPTPPCNER